MPEPPRLEILQPSTLADALALKAEHPAAVPLAGGTDLMVALNFRHTRAGGGARRHARPRATRLGAARRARARRRGRDVHAPDRRAGGSAARPGDRRPHGRLAADPQPRHGRWQPRDGVARRRRAAAAATRRTRRSSSRRCAARGACRSPSSSAAPSGPRSPPDELIAAFDLAAAAGPQQFAKVGTRNAMVIAVCSVSLALWPERAQVATCVGSAGPTPLRAPAAEAFIAGVLDEHDAWDRAARRSPTPRSRASASSSARPRGRSTTCAARRRTAATPSACWRAARCAGRGRSGHDG